MATLDGLYPGFVRINYTSVYGVHTMTVPTRLPAFAAPGNIPTYDAWDGVSTPAGDVMVEALVDAMLPNNLATTTFVSYDIYNVPVIDEPPQWIYGDFLTGKVGTLVNTGWAKAVQYTIGFRTALGGLLQVVNLDTPASNTFGNVVGLSARDADIATEILSTANAWQGRDGGQPLAFRGISITLNKRLRRKYGMV